MLEMGGVQAVSPTTIRSRILKVNHRPEATEDDRQLGALQRHTVGAGDAGGKEAAVHDSIHLQSTKVRRHTARIRSVYEAKKSPRAVPRALGYSEGGESLFRNATIEYHILSLFT